MKFVKVLKNYYAMNVGMMFALIGLVGTIFYASGRYGSGKIQPILFCLAVTVGGLAFIFINYLKVKKFFEAGIKARGTVTKTFFFRRWGTISYTYTYEGTDYCGKMVVSRNAETRSVENGAEITLLLDPTNSGKALIEELLS